MIKTLFSKTISRQWRSVGKTKIQRFNNNKKKKNLQYMKIARTHNSHNIKISNLRYASVRIHKYNFDKTKNKKSIVRIVKCRISVYFCIEKN